MNETQNNTLPILKEENINLIIQSAPKAYNDNITSHSRCLEAGQMLLQKIEEQGMTDELDQQVALFLDKAKKTVSKMYSNRTPVTKLFDEVRKVFTTIENNIDPAKTNTIPYQLQAHRNVFAAKKREEELQRQRIEQEKLQRQQRLQELEIHIENKMHACLSEKIELFNNHLAQLRKQLTLQNYDAMCQQISNLSTTLDVSVFSFGISNRLFRPLTDEEIEAKKKEIIAKHSQSVFNEYNNRTEFLKGETVEILPSLKAELERIAQASKEEAERIEKERVEREKQQAEAFARQQAEQLGREKQAQQLKAEAQQVNSMFVSNATEQAYKPNTKVSKKIQLLKADGILPIISYWWQHEGCTLSTDELAKIFKKQITFVEKVASKGGDTLKDANIVYVDEVKAK